MDTAAMLELCARKAREDEALRREFLATREMENPLEAFCGICRRLGCPLSPMDLVTAGEESYANMRRSTNGGGENSPMLMWEDDYYELFLAGL